MNPPLEYRVGVLLIRVELSDLGMCAAAAVGIGPLIWFACFVSGREEPRSGGDGTIERAEVLAIYSPRALIVLCRTLDVAAIRTDEE